MDRTLPKIDMGDILFIHDTGAHGFAMGYNYNGKSEIRRDPSEGGRNRQADPPGRDSEGLFCNL